MRIVRLLLFSLALLAAGAAAGYGGARYLEERRSAFTTPFQAVVLGNGAVFYGQIQGFGTNRPVLTHVYYVLAHNDPASGQNANVLVKRGAELHNPDRMYLNPKQIVYVEPVAPASRIARLIAENP